MCRENADGWHYRMAYAYEGKGDYEEALKYIDAGEKTDSASKERLTDFAKLRKKCEKALAKKRKTEKENQQQNNTSNKPVFDETKLQTVMELIEKAASLMTIRCF